MTVGWLRWFTLGLALAVTAGMSVGMAVDVFDGGWELLISIASATVVVLLAVHIAWRLARAQVESARSLDAVLNDRADDGSVPTASGDRNLAPDIRLVRAVSQVEHRASDVLAGRRGGAPRGLLALRLTLTDVGYWTREDVVKFDAAVRVRNAIVHRGAWGVSARKVTTALRDLVEVGDKLRPAPASPR